MKCTCLLVPTGVSRDCSLFNVHVTASRSAPQLGVLLSSEGTLASAGTPTSAGSLICAGTLASPGTPNIYRSTYMCGNIVICRDHHIFRNTYMCRKIGICRDPNIYRSASTVRTAFHSLTFFSVDDIARLFNLSRYPTSVGHISQSCTLLA